MTDSRPRSLADVCPPDDPVQAAWPDNTCYGCGQANPDGFGLESYPAPDRDALLATFDPEPTHAAGYPDFAYGGLLASLVDCHVIWTAIAARYATEGRRLLADDPLRMYVTGELTTRYLAPTPLDRPIELEARIDGDVGRKTDVVCEVRPRGGDPTVEARATAVEMRDPPALDAASDWPHASH
ncbi:PaaI family thioesterase [Halorubellus sp. JP-L1]|uniref:PaaI family thioesterase n=1 Tax=Halorubellus sp. JP-L1 TaxID=2715753 RepID=UPI0014085583|nr:PaaI family thioesterase [Halorubellus sp. JP-L1]NHN40845.1 PaaI family thioesterase [Halorubellus sp. JP-L1]